MNIGYIYKITNVINDKMYIGQTSKTIEKRFKEHLKDSQRINKTTYNCPLYRAMRKYGQENFIIECIEKCFIEELDEKEIFWIRYFNAFNNGYNATLGGSGGRLLDLDEEEIINDYKKYGTLDKVAKLNNCSPHSISYILKKHNVYVKSTIEQQKEKGNKIYQYTENKEKLLNVFVSRAEVGKWLIENNYSKSNKPLNAGDIITKKLQMGKYNILGFYWELENDYDESYKQKKIETKKEYNKKFSMDKCSLCNNNLKFKYYTYCEKCSKEIRKKQYDKQREEKISREELKSLIRTTPFTKIGKQYGVSDNAIRKWCKSYGLPSKSSEIKKYTDEEWEKL